ncbi:MAG: metalloregulator ArsR/SmtB family transcription factor [Halioglobus sp.]
MQQQAAKQSPALAPGIASSEDRLGELTSFFKASGDQLRLQILRVLRNESFGVSELCSLFDMRQPAMSHHLKVLSGAGLVATRREGNSIFYRRGAPVQDNDLKSIHSELLATVDEIELPPAVSTQMACLYRQREENSRNFFAGNAHKFRQQQDLIANYEQYGETVSQFMRDALPQHKDLALEIGPGDGAFLEQLSPRFERVVALDNSAEMLEKARKFAQEKKLKNIGFIHGDTSSRGLKNLLADCIVINMVLHHTPSPAEIFNDVAGLLGPAGVVIVTDLCSHDQAWARENCGDLWLGFEPEDLTRWAIQAGLTDIASVYLAQRNGFQIQVRLFGKPQ